MTDGPAANRRASDPGIAQLRVAVNDLDKRLALLERDVSILPTLAQKLDAIRDGMADPASSPLGRALLERAIKNATAIEILDTRVDGLSSWQNEMGGVAKFARLFQVVTAIVLTFIGIATVLLAVKT